MPASGNSQACSPLRALLVLSIGIGVVIPPPPTSVVFAQVPSAELRLLSRTGGQAGSEFDLHVLAGNFLEEIDELYFSNPRITTQLLTDDPLPFTDVPLPRFGHFRVAIPADVKPGRYEVCFRGRHGISNSRIFWVGSFPDAFPTEISHQAAQPTPLPNDAWLHARAVPAVTDYFSIRCIAGQTIHVELLAQRIDSRMIGELRLYDTTGGELKRVQGGDDVDPVLEFAVEQAGDYLLAVRDILYRGGDEYPYQISLQNNLSCIARSCPDAQGAEDSTASIGQLPRWSHPSAILLARDDESTAALGWNLAESRTLSPLSAPCRVRGAFSPEKNETIYEMEAIAGDDLAVEVFSQRLGEPTDPLLLVERREASSVGEPQWLPMLTQDDSQTSSDLVMPLRSRDPAAVFKASANEIYRVRVCDLDVGEALGATQSYWLDLRHASPDFALVAYRPCPIADAAQSRPVGTNLWRAGTEAIRVAAIRRDHWSGPIEVSVEGLPDGVECLPATIAANQHEVQLTLVACEDAPAWNGALKIVGRGVGVDGELVRNAVPATIVCSPGGGRQFVHTRLAADLVLSVSDRDVAQLFVQVGEPSGTEVKRGASLAIPIRLTRRDGGKENCLLRPRDLPPGVASADVTIPAEASEGELQLTVAPETVPGTYSFWLLAETGFTVKLNPQALQRAEQYRADLVKRLDDPEHAGDRDQINAALQIADQRMEAAKPAAQDQRVGVLFPSAHATIRIVE